MCIHDTPSYVINDLRLCTNMTNMYQHTLWIQHILSRKINLSLEDCDLLESLTFQGMLLNLRRPLAAEMIFVWFFIGKHMEPWRFNML
jgi:hypothetical protein